MAPAPNKDCRRSTRVVTRCNHDGIASLLFTVRSSKVSTHKGQVGVFEMLAVVTAMMVSE